MRIGIIVLLLSVIVACGTKKNTEPVSEFSAADYPYIELFHQAIRHKMRGQYPEAIQAFEKCKSIKPMDDAIYYGLAQVYLITQQYSKSAENIQQAVKLQPKNKWYVQEYAFMLFETRNFAEAAKQFKKLVDEEPENLEWLYSYAECLMRSGETAQSIKVLDKLEKEIGINPELSVQKFNMYINLKQDSKAIAELEKALVEYPSDPQLLGNLVDYYFQQKQDEKAFNYLIKLAEANPENGNAHLALAQYYDQKGLKDKAYQELGLAFKASDVKLDSKMKILLSMFESQYKLDPQLFDLVGILIEKYPTEARVHTLRGDFYMKAEMEDEALKNFKKALEFDKSKFAIWEQVLIMEYKRQDYNALYTDSKTCLEFFTTQPKIFLFFGLAANQTKNYEQAIEKLDIGIDLIVNDNAMKAEMLSQKAEALFSLKKPKEGSEAYEQALKLDADNVLFKNNYAYRLALAKKDLDKAESLILQVIKQSPNESHFLDTYGWILFQKGNYAQALDQFKKAHLIRESDKHIIEHLGDAHAKLGNIAEALNYWKKAKELGSTNLKLNDKIEKKTYLDPEY